MRARPEANISAAVREIKQIQYKFCHSQYSNASDIYSGLLTHGVCVRARGRVCVVHARAPVSMKINKATSTGRKIPKVNYTAPVVSRR